MATGNPIAGADQDVAALVLQVKENVENLYPANFGEGKHHDRSYLAFVNFWENEPSNTTKKSTAS